VDEVSRCYCPPSTASRQNFELERADEIRPASRNYFIYQGQVLQLMKMIAYDINLGVVDSLHTLSELAA
jgi:hypothetical protein